MAAWIHVRVDKTWKHPEKMKPCSKSEVQVTKDGISLESGKRRIPYGPKTGKNSARTFQSTPPRKLNRLLTIAKKKSYSTFTGSVGSGLSIGGSGGLSSGSLLIARH
jgi:hypothetical protein